MFLYIYVYTYTHTHTWLWNLEMLIPAWLVFMAHSSACSIFVRPFFRVEIVLPAGSAMGWRDLLDVWWEARGWQGVPSPGVPSLGTELSPPCPASNFAPSCGKPQPQFGLFPSRGWLIPPGECPWKWSVRAGCRAVQRHGQPRLLLGIPPQVQGVGPVPRADPRPAAAGPLPAEFKYSQSGRVWWF